MYSRSILPLVFWHGMCDLTAFITYGILPLKTVVHYEELGTLSLQNVLDVYGILDECSFGAEIVYSLINILFVVLGIVLIFKAEKKQNIVC